LAKIWLNRNKKLGRKARENRKKPRKSKKKTGKEQYSWKRKKEKNGKGKIFNF
jgi:hypothetical protein